MILPPAHIDVYYASTCVPCRLELPVLRSAIVNGMDIRIVIVSDQAQAKLELGAAQLADRATLAPGISARDRLRRAGDQDSILPFARTVRMGTKACATWRGILTLPRIKSLLSSCSTT